MVQSSTAEAQTIRFVTTYVRVLIVELRVLEAKYDVLFAAYHDLQR